MPYITQRRRVELDDSHAYPDTAGELNYTVTNVLIDNDCPIKMEREISEAFTRYLESCGKSYQTYNDIVGVGFLAVHKYKRRTKTEGLAQVVATGLAVAALIPDLDVYEDTKIKANGDVYPAKASK